MINQSKDRAMDGINKKHLREKVLHILIDYYKEDCNYDPLMAIMREVDADRKQHELDARQSEVESMAVIAVDMPELLPLLSKRLEQIEAERALTNPKPASRSEGESDE